MDDDLRRRADKNLREMRDDGRSRWMDRLLYDMGQRALGDPERIPTQAHWAGATLTDRELQAVSAASVGLTTPMTADLMFISTETVKIHRKAAIYKLRAKNMTHAVAIALRQGLIA